MRTNRLCLRGKVGVHHRASVKRGFPFSSKTSTELSLSSTAPTFRTKDWRRCTGAASVALTVLRNLVGYYCLGKRTLRPLLVAWHVTLRCNLACAFCDDGRGRKYPEVRYPELQTAEALRLLELIRQACRSIYFTGGEPFVRKDFPHLLKRSRELGFWPIIVNTNLSLREPLEAAVQNIDVLVASLGSTDAGYDRVLQSRPGQTKRILENLRSCARWQAHGGPRVVVNCVICPTRVQDARSVLAFCLGQGLWFSPVPVVRGTYVDPNLLASAEYDELVDDILAAKKQGSAIYGSLRGLETLLRARSFRCYPTLAPQLYPNGDLFYPCKALRHRTSNILDSGYFEIAWRSARKEFSSTPACDNRCHLACYVYHNQWMEHPLETALEIFRVARQQTTFPNEDRKRTDKTPSYL